MSTTPQRGRRGKKVRVAMVVTGMTGLATAGTTVVPTAANAGTDGQHVKVCALLPPDDSVSIVGSQNQSGNPAHTGWRKAAPHSCWEFTNYWWKGEITVYFRSSPHVSAFFSSFHVPTTQKSNWITVNA
jgi:hypothetical protein